MRAPVRFHVWQDTLEREAFEFFAIMRIYNDVSPVQIPFKTAPFRRS
jgi:hypothetical protein